jgi:hypothetical protein
MTEAEAAAIATMTPEELISGFVRESKLIELGRNAGAKNRAVDAADAYADEIARRGGLPSLAPLMDGADSFIAYAAADRLGDVPEFRERALVVLDRIVEARLGFTSGRADTARNMIRYGNPNGDPVEYERRLVEIRERENRG